MSDLLILRIIFVVILSSTAFYLRPLNLEGPYAAAIGAFLGCTIVIFELRLRQVSLKRLIGAAFGSLPARRANMVPTGLSRPRTGSSE